MRKSPKNRLGRSPQGTPLWYQAGTASSLYFGPSPLLWLLPLPPHQAPWAAGPMARWFPPPGLLWKSGVPAAGGQAPDSWHQGKALAIEACTIRGVNTNCRTASHLCDPTQDQGRNQEDAGASSTAGWIPQGGGRPRLWWVFGDFLPSQKVTLRSTPGCKACIWKNRRTGYLSPSTEIIQFVSRET